MASVLSREEVQSLQDSEKGQERLWIEAAQAGDPVAFNRLVLKWEQPIYNLTLRMLGDPEEAAEITQETFLSAYKSLHRFRREAKFSTWLYRIASNHSISRLRKRPPGTQYSLDDSASFINARPRTGEHQEKQVLEQERQQKVRLALDQLQPAGNFAESSLSYRGRGRSYDVTPDGQRFLMIKEGGQTEEASEP
ncbi:MAG: sigma-70 family RNA polymerase sigma factor, partial [Acidobacteriota bacterium]